MFRKRRRNHVRLRGRHDRWAIIAAASVQDGALLMRKSDTRRICQRYCLRRDVSAGVGILTEQWTRIKATLQGPL